jgi:hypothetical protein
LVEVISQCHNFSSHSMFSNYSLTSCCFQRPEPIIDLHNKYYDLRRAPHPESQKFLHTFVLVDEQSSSIDPDHGNQSKPWNSKLIST